MAGRQPLATWDELAAAGQLRVTQQGEEILLVRAGEGCFALAYYCSHQDLPLEGGEVADGCITCPYHGAVFRLRDGEALTLPATGPVKTYPVEVADGVISLVDGSPG